MWRLALRVPDLDASVAFYSKLFGTEPAKLRNGYANFAITEPPLKLVLIEGTAGEATRMDHLGVEVETTEAVHAATTRLSESGMATDVENDTTNCYALQDKVWVHGPGQEPWEVYVVNADADSLAKQQDSTATLQHRPRIPRNRPARATAADQPTPHLQETHTWHQQYIR
ncbi:ArsI/CadI family heavy metal resistance metalloenzyme [Streptomyces massasporeus]|uniref:ArsI/CadI family heavy metal resistance metalloenzyme n=1 Tax=Streptomyces massasporeus TaxID=67324 RepID=UPI003818D83C